MAPTPSRSIAPDFTQDLKCPICGQDSLRVHAMERFPDYVACGNCDSQFVVEEGGERVMYGKIPAAYPRTRRFALQQWAWPEAVARRAAQERPDHVDLPASATAPPPDITQGPSEPSETIAPPAEEAEPAAEEPGAPADIFEQPMPEPSREESELPEQASPLAAESTEEPGEELPTAGDDLGEGEPDVTPSAEAAEPSWMSEAEPTEMGGAGGAPPFGAAPPESETEGEFPSEIEPAPEMPDWLQGGSGEGERGAAPLPEQPAAEPTSLGQEPPAEEDLTASVWDDQGLPDEPTLESPEGPEPTQAGPTEFERAAAAEAEEDDLTALFDEESDLLPDFESPSFEQEGEAAGGADRGEPAKPAGDEGLSEAEVAQMLWTGQVAERGQDEAEAAALEETAATAGGEREPEEPEPGTRYRVVLQGGEARFPKEICAHCGRTPVAGSLSLTATVYLGTGLGERKVKSYRIPVCAECRRRATARSEEQQTARIQAHLVSVLVGLVMVVGGLAFGLIDFQRAVLLNLAVLLLLGGMGYLIPAVFLLLRASRHSKPPDATFVETTLRVPADTEGIETAFEWRNPTYAQLFLNANQEIAASRVSKIRERSYEG